MSPLTELPSPGSHLVRTIPSIALPQITGPLTGVISWRPLCAESGWGHPPPLAWGCFHVRVILVLAPVDFFSHSTGDFPVSWYDEWFSTESWRFWVSRHRGHVILEMPEGTKQCPCHTSRGRLLSDVTDLPWLSQGQTYQSSRKIFKDGRSQDKDSSFFPSNGCQLL